jgi:hypothetical protein
MNREPESMMQIHRIMEAIYEEEKDLTSQERLDRLHQESSAFLRRAGINLKQVSPPPRRAAG